MSPARKLKDYAVVVGINKYPRHDEYDDLKGAKRDAEIFRDWLGSPDGGDIRAKSRIDGHFSSRDGKQPRLDVIIESIDDLVDLQLKHGLVGRRLYMFMAGHGAGKSKSNSVLLTADHGGGNRDSYFQATKIAEMFVELGAFKEVLLFMDCCRDHESGLGPTVEYKYDPEVGGNAAEHCFGFGAIVNHQTFEKKFGNSYHGIFSWVLMEGLKGGASNEVGEVTAGELEDYVKKQFNDLNEKPPEFSASDPDLVLATGVEPTLVPVEVRLPSSRAVFEVRKGTNFNTVLQVKTEKIAPKRWLIYLRPDRLYLVGLQNSRTYTTVKPAEDGHVPL